MKAVVWSDVFQTTVLFGSLFSIIIKGKINNGGVKNVWESSYQTGRMEFFNLDFGPYVRHTFSTSFIGAFITTCLIYDTHQAMIQRYLSLPSLKEAQKLNKAYLISKEKIFILVIAK
jgi:Na+/proline symporter